MVCQWLPLLPLLLQLLMAENMCRLIVDNELAHTLSTNALKTIDERYSNSANMHEWRDNYYAILNNER